MASPRLPGRLRHASERRSVSGRSTPLKSHIPLLLLGLAGLGVHSGTPIERHELRGDLGPVADREGHAIGSPRHTRPLLCAAALGLVKGVRHGLRGEPERARFDAHVAECPDCATYLRTYSDTIRLAKDAHADDPVPADVPEDLVRAILDARPPTRRRR